MAREQWMRHFMQRHNTDPGALSIRNPEAKSLSRSANKYIFLLPPHRIWNLDETGFSTVQTLSIGAAKGEKQIGSCTSAKRGNLVTIIIAIKAISNQTPTHVCFSKGTFQRQNAIWCSTSIGTSYRTSSLPKKPILLLLDKHESHLSVEALGKASEAGIVIATFPLHASHKLQPLDLAVYGPLKRY
ncbi:hypothetical protein J437_LFUL015797 [Ladona fulva]|uniref:DDE-1 domain-containing protein n=1 Tax=Ladona fulva TaxID=123851 RepID=A0A8K0KHQ9_LADFU|nr:hypothetical protein J437_LFUL015797 [Ladona fulva]